MSFLSKRFWRVKSCYKDEKHKHPVTQVILEDDSSQDLADDSFSEHRVLDGCVMTLAA